MTPLEQTGLPWLRLWTAEDRRQDALLEGIVLPSLRAMGRRAEGDRAHEDDLLSITSPSYEGTMLSVLCPAPASEGPDDRVRVNLHVHPLVAAAMGHPHRGADPAMIGIATSVLERVMASPRAPHAPIGPADADRIALAGLRLIETAVLPGRDASAALCTATPLGLGGVHVAADDGLRFDRSPDLIRPGPVEMCVVDARLDGNRRSIVVNIGSTAAAVRCRPMDPLARLRLEALHPWDPDAIHEDGRMPPSAA